MNEPIDIAISERVGGLVVHYALVVAYVDDNGEDRICFTHSDGLRSHELFGLLKYAEVCEMQRVMESEIDE